MKVNSRVFNFKLIFLPQLSLSVNESGPRSGQSTPTPSDQPFSYHASIWRIIPFTGHSGILPLSHLPATESYPVSSHGLTCRELFLIAGILPRPSQCSKKPVRALHVELKGDCPTRYLPPSPLLGRLRGGNVNRDVAAAAAMTLAVGDHEFFVAYPKQAVTQMHQ